MIAERIKSLREVKGMTQSELARKLSITRSSVNAWELGFSTPSTQYIVELANLFSVSTDYLLGLEKTSSIDVCGLDDDDIKLITSIVNHLKNKN